jgi:predicted transcriptional regulator YdeE
MTNLQSNKTQEISMLIENMITRENQTEVMRLISVAICTKQITQGNFYFLVNVWQDKAYLLNN